MTVADLIARLQACDPRAAVLLGAEGELYPPSFINETTLGEELEDAGAARLGEPADKVVVIL